MFSVIVSVSFAARIAPALRHEVCDAVEHGNAGLMGHDSEAQLQPSGPRRQQPLSLYQMVAIGRILLHSIVQRGRL
jgi:hypothetical protein